MKVERYDLKENRTRSLAKAITYRILILTLDFTTVYLLTGKFEISFGFTMVSNVYTSIAYYIHERIWDRTNWGKKPSSPS